jgi:hypothetical protein
VVEALLTPGAVVGIDGSGFDGPLVNLFVPGRAFAGLAPLPGATASHLDLRVPADAPVGPATLQVIDQPYAGTVVSKPVAVVGGARLGIDSITQEGTTIRVRGTGCTPATVINLFNRQGNATVNLGGLDARGGPAVPLTVLSSTELTFTVPAGAADGPASAQLLNPPFSASSSSGDDPDGAFHLIVP